MGRNARLRHHRHRPPQTLTATRPRPPRAILTATRRKKAPPAKKMNLTQTHTTVQIPASAAGTMQVSQESGPAAVVIAETTTTAQSGSSTPSTNNPANTLINKDRFKKMQNN